MTKYENVNVVIGPKDAVDAIKPKVDTFIKSCNGSFESVDRIQAMWFIDNKFLK